MIQRTEYAVRVKGTHKYLPRPQRRDGRGGSHLEPLDFSDPSSWPKDRYRTLQQIRSYATKAAAQNLLNSWLQGKFTGAGWEEEYGYTEVRVTKQSHRRPELMEIVEITITLPEIAHKPHEFEEEV